jgi:hypothetical protein
MRFDSSLLRYTDAQNDLFYKLLLQRRGSPDVKSEALATVIPRQGLTLGIAGVAVGHEMFSQLEPTYLYSWCPAKEIWGKTLTADGDYRVWVVSIKKAAGPSLFH